MQTHSNWPHNQNLGHQNHTMRFHRRATHIDTYHSAAGDDHLTIPRLVGGLMFAGTLVLAYVVLAAWF